MQHKRHLEKLKIGLLVAAGLAFVGLIVLMTVTIPSPQRTIEKQLDAKAFLEPKPQQQ